MYSVSESHIKYTLWNCLDPLLCSIFSWICSLVAVFLPDLGIAALSHFFGKCRTIISPKSLKVAKKEKTYYKTYASIWHIDTFPYNASPNLIQLLGYGIFRKHTSLSKTQNVKTLSWLYLYLQRFQPHVMENRE